MLGTGMDIPFGTFDGVHTDFVGADNNFVVYVGIVHDMAHFVTAILQIAADDVEHDGGHGVAYMSIGVDGWAANIHADEMRLERFEGFFLASQDIINTNCHY